jgi:glycosyltransferase involved in cell wall biosynthesis
LCRQAQGDLIAFLDPDDVWHPRYLETQCKLVDQYPDAVAYFTDHEQFTGLGGHAWNGDPTESEQGVAVMTSVQFLIRYLRSYSPFIPSNLCVPRSALLSLGDEPFKLRNSEDVYFFHLLAPRGRIVYLPQKLAGYRIREESYSSSRIRTAKAEVHVFELLADQYSALEDSGLRNTYWRCFATKRRMYAKHLLGIGDLALARDQIHKSLLISGPASKAKSLRLLLLSYLPAALQPEWPPEYRGWAGPRES